MKGQFNANNLSKAARRAVYSRGMKSVKSYNILAHVNVPSEYEDAWNTEILEVFGSRDNVIKLTAGDVFLFETLYKDVPLARVR